MIDTTKNILANIWTNQLKEYFDNTTFCSERHFQAEFYRHLATELEKVSLDFKVFVEPRIELKIERKMGKKTGHSCYDMRPDLVVAYQNQLLGIIELKYQIKTPAVQWQNDIAKLRAFAEGAVEANTKIYAELEETGEKPYTLNSEILCCFAVITKEFAPATLSSIWQKFPTENWLHLTGNIGRKKIVFVANSLADEIMQ